MFSLKQFNKICAYRVQLYWHARNDVAQNQVYVCKNVCLHEICAVCKNLQPTLAITPIKITPNKKLSVVYISCGEKTNCGVEKNTSTYTYINMYIHTNHMRKVEEVQSAAALSHDQNCVVYRTLLAITINQYFLFTNINNIQIQIFICIRVSQKDRLFFSH